MRAPLYLSIALLSVSLMGCPNGGETPDGGTDAGSDASVVIGDCAGECAANEVCNSETRTCESACGAPCEAGNQCVKDTDNAFRCLPQAPVACNGVACADGQAACVSGGCSCLPARMGGLDSCSASGQICNGPFNPAVSGSGQCRLPVRNESCTPETGCAPGLGCAAGICGATCGTGSSCPVDQLCDGNSNTCLPKTLFGQVGDCARRGEPVDGGEAPLSPTPVAESCLIFVRSGQNFVPEPDPATGTCTYSVIALQSQMLGLSQCRSPGSVPLHGRCQVAPTTADAAPGCQQGLECVSPNGTNDGICFPICNAAQSSVPVTPGCDEGTACVNVHGQLDPLAVAGACMPTCNIFGAPCANVGTIPTVCSPISPQADRYPTPDGAGLCVPALVGAQGGGKTEGQGCEQVNPLTGSSCAEGLICATATAGAAPICIRPCDVECASDAPPARCATLQDTTCTGGKTCTQVSAPSLGTVGYCL